jgi:dienelactone hydrolase
MFIIDVLIIVLSFSLMIVFLNKNRINPKVMTILFFLIILSYMINDFIQPRSWQLIPIYFSLVLFLIFAYIKSPKTYMKIIYASISSLLILCSLGLFYAFPTRDIPDPSGEYKVASFHRIIEDEERLELYTDDPLDTRRFMIKFWYPSTDTNPSDPYNWIGNRAITNRLAKDMGIPAFLLDHINDIPSNSKPLVPMNNSEESYPVVIISHGWGGFMTLHTDLAEELASRGYVVVAIDHTYGSVASTFIDETVYQNKDALPDREDPNFLDAANQLVYTYAGDIIKTLDYLEEENELTPYAFFEGKLDLDNIGLLGHSTGGGADVAVALNDTRIKALLGLDAWVEPILQTEITKGLSIPSVFLRSETWETGPNNDNLSQLILNSSHATLYQIDGTTHSDFSMAYMFSTLTGMLGITGSLDADYLLHMQKDIMNSFFDEHLKGEVNQTIDLTVYDELIEIMFS